ncbi:hypothetical protein IQ267_04495 [filamentous cyanobacterium LEGE 07170]|nr:hypothetical protein [filamentous cyanobacterium LEGE 07170]
MSPNQSTHHNHDLQKRWSKEEIKDQAKKREDEEEERKNSGAVEPQESCYASHANADEK